VIQKKMGDWQTPRHEGFDAGCHHGKADSLHAQIKQENYPTPTSSMATMADMEQARFAGNGGKRPDYATAKEWPTPRAGDIDSTRTKGNKKDGRHLGMEVKAWQTPAAQDAKNATFPPSQQERDTLPGALMRENWPTPKCPSGGGQVDTGALNPGFVELLMGFPEHWTDTGIEGTLLSTMSLTQQVQSDTIQIGGVINVISNKTNSNKVLPSLWECNDAQEISIQESDRTDEYILKEAVLQQGMRGDAAKEGDDNSHVGLLSFSQTDRGAVCGMRHHEQSACTPQRHEQSKQQYGQPDDSLCSMPHARTLQNRRSAMAANAGRRIAMTKLIDGHAPEDIAMPLADIYSAVTGKKLYRVRDITYQALVEWRKQSDFIEVREAKR